MALQDTALKLIRKFGEERAVVLEIPNQAPADPAKPWEVNPTNSFTTVTVPAVVVPVGRSFSQQSGRYLIDGSSVQQGDETVLIAGLSLGSTVPTPNDFLTDEAVRKTILAVVKIKPGKTDFLYKLLVRASNS